MNKRQRTLALAEILQSMLDKELNYRQDCTGDASNAIYGRDYNLKEALRSWKRLETA